MVNSIKNEMGEITEKVLVSVVIVTYKSWGHLDECLTSLSILNSPYFDLDVVVVDNDIDSEERSTFIEKYKEFLFIENSDNNGFSNGCNLGASYAKGGYFLFLNPDTVVSEESLRAMLFELISNKEYGIVSCLQINRLGAKEKQVRFFPSIYTIFGLFRAIYRSRTKSLLSEKFGSDKSVIYPDWVSGSVVFISKEWFVKVGGWNEDYWMYYEDVSISRNVIDNGGKVALLRTVKIIHNHGGASRLNAETSALTKSEVIISRHVYVQNNFTGALKFLTHFLLVGYVFIGKSLLAFLSIFLFFIPKMKRNLLLFRDLVYYYVSSIRYRTWLSLRSMNHPLKASLAKESEGGLNIGFDAKRAFHNRTGLGNYSRDLVSLLSKRFSKNNYYLFNPKPKKIDRLEARNNIVEILPASYFWKKNSSIWRLGPVVTQLLANKIAIFHGLSGEIPKGLKFTGIKSVVTIHDLIFIRYPKLYSFMDRKIHFRKFWHAVHNADQVIAISEQTKRDIVEFLKVKPSKIKVIYQGCHKLFKEEQSNEYKSSVREKFNLPKQFILNVGTIETRKNLLLAVKAIKKIDTVLVVVGGETSYIDVVKEYIDSKNMHDKVLFLKDVDLKELVAIYQMASLMVYPSLFEGFGIPIIEALYSKTPVITSTGSCFSEAGGMHSIYINPFDHKELESKIIEVLESKELQMSMVKDGLEYVQKFNDEVIAEEMMKVYNDLLVHEK